MAISQSVWRQFAPLRKTFKKSWPVKSVSRQSLLDISQDIRQRYSPKRYRLSPAEKNCVLMQSDLQHLHVYWSQQQSADNFVVKVSSTFRSTQPAMEFFYRLPSKGLDKQAITLILPQQTIGALHQASLGHFDEQGRFQAVITSNVSMIKTTQTTVASSSQKAIAGQSGAGLPQ